MKRKLLSALFLCMILCGAVTTAYAADAEAYNAADVLYDLGLFSGTGTKADGSPNFDLDRTPTRHEAVTMLVSLLGKKDEALAGEWETPFTDVADWAKPFVGYAYANGLTSGTSATTYSGDAPLTAAQYFTFVLKALGYETGTDFQWDKSFEFAAQIGLTDNRYATSKDFFRGDVTIVSRNALDVEQKDSELMLSEKLIAEGVFTKAALEQTVKQPLVLEEPTDKPDEVDVTFAINGEMLPWDWHYRAAAGKYVVTPYRNGQPFDEYEVEIEDGKCSVSKNGDGTFTVNFPAKEECSISLYYNFLKHENVNEKGETTTSISRTKRSLSFNISIPNSGFALSRKNWTLLSGASFGQNTTPYYVLDVYYNGKRIDDYTVKSSGSSITASVQADGSLLLMKNGGGKSQFTISYQGRSASFAAWGDM